jgi:NADH-quinone oxidoreductase subunit N
VPAGLSGVAAATGVFNLAFCLYPAPLIAAAGLAAAALLG